MFTEWKMQIKREFSYQVNQLPKKTLALRLSTSKKFSWNDVLRLEIKKQTHSHWNKSICFFIFYK